MSRISRYREILDKFIKKKSSMKNLDTETKNRLTKILDENNYLISIILLSILNNQSKKNNLKQHGYYMASGIEFLMIIIRNQDQLAFNKLNQENNINVVCNSLINLTNLCLTDNINYIKSYISRTKINFHFNTCSKILNKKINDIFKEVQLKNLNKITKSDLTKYQFKDENIIKKKISNFEQIEKKSLLEFIELKYGSICQITIITAWLLGGGDDSNINELEQTGTYLGNIIKVCYDFENVEYDINNCTKSTENFVINYGIQTAFEFFIDNKFKFVEKCLLLDFYTTTIKEILDLYELKVDNFINNTTSDLISQYSINNSK
jgi:hypothetical protein